MSIMVLCPTKGRPDAANAAWKSFLETKALDTTEMLFVVNESEDTSRFEAPFIRVPDREWMNEVLQAGSDHVIKREDVSVIGFVGDDNRFRTAGWDRRVADALANGGYAYGNDLAQGPNLPAHVFISSSIVRELGWFGMPTLRHLYLDNAWKTLGLGAGCLFYLPDVIVEHLHPIFGKGEMDDSYRETNSGQMYAHDESWFRLWLESGQSDRDIETVKAALHA